MMEQTNRRERQAGAAVVTSVIFLALVGVVAAAVAVTARLRLTRATAFINGARAYYVAEAGLAAALAGLPAGLAFTRSLAGPDGFRGSGDDGTLPYGDLVGEMLDESGATVELLAEDDRDEEPPDPLEDSNEKIRLRVLGAGQAQTRRVLEAVVGREEQAYDPAALVLPGGIATLGGEFLIDGSDHRLGGLCGSLSGEPARAGIAVSDPAALANLEAELLLNGAERVTGAGGVPSLALMRPADTDYLNQVIGGAALESPGGVVAGTWGDTVSPTSAVVLGDASVEAVLEGCGALVVTGNLLVTGTVDFRGVLIVGGSLRVAPTGTLVVCGAVWSEGPVTSEGTFAARHSAEAVGVADGQMRLARLPRLLAAREGF